MGVLNNIQRFKTFDIREYLRNFQRQIQTGLKLDANNNYDIQQKRLADVGEGVDGSDAITKHQMEVGLATKPDSTSVLLLDGRNHMTGDLDMRGNKIILPGEIDMDRKLITNLDTDPNQDLSAVNMVTLKNNIGSKADKGYVDGEITKLVKKTGDVLTGDLILPHDSYPVQGNTNKAVSYETQREIFLSRKESFPMQVALNMNNNFIENVATPTTAHQGANKGYCDYNFLNRQKGGRLMGALSMNQNDLFEIPAPKYGSSAVNKNYVDAKIPSVDLTQFVKKSGDRMGGDLDMAAHFIKNVGINLSDDSTVVPRSYVDSFANSAIHNPLTTDLNMRNHQIKKLKKPTDAQDAINKKYFDDELLKSHLISSHIENAFKYLLDADESSSERSIIVNGIKDFPESPHKNKKAYSVNMIYTPGTQNYISNIGINIFSLPIGKYTIVMEYYFPENLNIYLNCWSSSHVIINRQFSNNFPDYEKILVQFDQRTKDTPDYLYFWLKGSGTTSTNPEGYLIFYGVKGWMDSVPPEIYDRALETGMFEYDGGNMKMNMDLDLNGNSLIGVREDYFHLKGNYKSSVNNQNVLFGNNASTKVPFGGYLIEVYVLISSAAVGNDYAFRLIISGHEHYTSNAVINSTGNSKFHRLMDFNKNHFLPSGRGFAVTISHDSHASTPPKFTEAKFYFKFFRDDNFS